MISLNTDDYFEVCMFVATRCLKEGIAARRAGKKASDCPYLDKLEREAWLDGFMRNPNTDRT
jgi:ribosome modulation factor